MSRTSEESGSRIFAGREAKRLREAQAGLERHDQEVDQVGKPALDLLAALPCARVDDEHRHDPAEHGGADGGEEQQRRAAAGECREPEREECAGDGAEKLRPEEPLGRRAVHPGRHEPGAVILAPKAAEPLAEVATRRRREVVQAGAEPRALVVVRGRERAGEAVGADLLDGLRGRAGRDDERPDDQRDGNREKEEPEDESEEVRHLRARS